MNWHGVNPFNISEGGIVLRSKFGDSINHTDFRSKATILLHTALPYPAPVGFLGAPVNFMIPIVTSSYRKSGPQKYGVGEVQKS